MGDKQYNYDSKLYKTYHNDGACKTISCGCEYCYTEPPTVYTENKDLHDRWLTTLILSIFIVVCNIGLLIFGFLLFKSSGESNEGQTVQIV